MKDILHSPVTIGMSAAASWAWGTSLIIGMQIAQQKGLVAWMIWAVANSLTLILFGGLTNLGLLGRKVFNKRPIKICAIGIQMLCLVIQLNIIYEVLKDLGCDDKTAYSVASGIGVIFTLWMYKHGLKTSIYTDVFQWTLTIITIFVIINLGIYNHVPLRVIPESSYSDVLWGMWSALILLSGPIGDVQHWQRAELDPKSFAYGYGTIFFAFYMCLILILARYQFNTEMNACLLFAVLCVTTSTIDSIAVALHEVSNKQIGTFIAIGICVSWGILADIGVLSLWSHAGIFRVLFATTILILAIYYACKNNKKVECS